MKEQDALLTAVSNMLVKLDSMTSEEFAHGGEKNEREAMRDAVAAFTTPKQALHRLSEAAWEIASWRSQEGIADITGDRFAVLASAQTLAAAVLARDSG